MISIIEDKHYTLVSTNTLELLIKLATVTSNAMSKKMNA